MTSSGTVSFNPSLGELILYAFNLCGIRNTEIVQEHLESARMAANLLQSNWSARGVNTWEVDLQTVPLVAGQATYSVPADTIVMLEAYVTVGSGAGTVNRILMPISRTEYAAYSNPQQTGSVGTFWFDRLLAPTFTLYLVPDGSQPTLSYYRMKRIQDAALTNGATLDMPYYFLEALALGLGYRLALLWAPDKVAMLKALADEAYQIATEQNQELGHVYITPAVTSYFTR